jgi:hypothetical protein
MKYLHVGFSTHSSLFSWLIRTVTSSKISHTYIKLPTGYDELVIFQASGLSVNYCNWNYFKSRNKILYGYTVEISDEQWEKAERFRVTEVGKPYSIKQILGFGYTTLMHAFGKKAHNPMSDGDHSYVCVEVVAKCIGIDGAEDMSPEDLWRWCRKNAFRVY